MGTGDNSRFSTIVGNACVVVCAVYSVGVNEPSNQYTGQKKDGTGLYYYGARYYDPELGRFISPDTVLDGLNRYAYCGNNPINYVDPTGNELKPTPTATGTQMVDDGKEPPRNPNDPGTEAGKGGEEKKGGTGPKETPKQDEQKKTDPDNGKKRVTGEDAKKPSPETNPENNGDKEINAIKIMDWVEITAVGIDCGEKNALEPIRSFPSTGSQIADDALNTFLSVANISNSITLNAPSVYFRGITEEIQKAKEWLLRDVLGQSTETIQAIDITLMQIGWQQLMLSRAATMDAAGSANLGQKINYAFGEATGNAHNIARSQQMLRQLESIGIHNTAGGRAAFTQAIRNAYSNAKGVVQANGRTSRAFMLMGPNGGLKVNSIWSENTLITIEIFGGK